MKQIKIEVQKAIAAVLTIIVLVALMPILLQPYSDYKNFYLSVNKIIFSHISEDEYKAGKWLKENVSIQQHPNSYILSDHSTSYLIRGMTGLNSTAGRHPNISVEEWKGILILIKEISSVKVNDQTFAVIDNIKEKTQSSDIYFVFSTRTCWWTQQQDLGAIRHLPMPEGYTLVNYCPYAETYGLDYRFDPVFQNKDIVILKYNK